MLAELHNQGKQITLCKVSGHIVIKGNEQADKAPKQAIDMPGMTTTKLPHTEYYLIIRGLETPSGKGNRKQYQ